MDNTPETKEIDRIKELEKKIEELSKPNDADYEAKLDRLVTEKLRERLKENNGKDELERAKQLVHEAQEREKLQKELDENLKYQTKKDKIARMKEEIIFGLNEIVKCGDERNYNNLVFDFQSDVELHKHTRDLYFLVKRFGAEKVYDYMEQSLFPRYKVKQK